MSVIRNLFALIGLLFVLGAGYVVVEGKDKLHRFDPDAGRVYLELVENILATKNAADATVWKVQVKKELSPEEVEETMKMVANEHNMSNVGELPLYKDVEAKSGKPYRFVKIYLFCDSLIAAQMLDYNDAFSAYLPCRITLIEDKEGRLWLMALNMDLMIHGGESLPPALKQEAIKVKEMILDIMNRGAAGDF